MPSETSPIARSARAVPCSSTVTTPDDSCPRCCREYSPRCTQPVAPGTPRTPKMPHMAKRWSRCSYLKVLEVLEVVEVLEGVHLGHLDYLEHLGMSSSAMA